MSSVSELIGFLVIFIFPRPDHPKDRTRQALLHTKSSESLIRPFEEEVGSEEDIESIPSTSQVVTVNNKEPVARAKHSEPFRSSALSKPEFWMIACIMSMCMSSLIYKSNVIVSGCGLMYINVFSRLSSSDSQNVGHCVDALFGVTGNHRDYSVQLAKLQAAHVSIISLSSCAGRVTAGTSSDILLKRYGLPRTWCLVCASVVAILAQLCGWLINSIERLVLISISPFLILVYHVVSGRVWIWALVWLLACHWYSHLRHLLTPAASELFGIE